MATADDSSYEEIHTDPFEIKQPEKTTSWTGSVTYNCYWDKFRRPGAQALLQWKFQTKNESSIPSDPEQLDKYMPVHDVDMKVLDKPPADRIQVTWIGHATVLVQFDGITILSDPLFRAFAGPESAAYIKSTGYQRYRKAACQGKDIPKVDAVIISHNHYDHLDTGSVKEVYAHHNGVKWFVPKGMKAWLGKHGITEHIHEMTWTQDVSITHKGKDFKFICLPAQHWCQRGAMDLNKVLWCSWAVKGLSSNNFSYYFGGDTGYHGPLFKKIGQEYGPFSLAALPIGAYHPRFVLKYQHSDPGDAVNIHTDIRSCQSIGIHWGTLKTMACEGAVQIHSDIRSEQSIGIHWGTFELTNEFFLEPPNKVKEIMEERGLDPAKFPSLILGKTWVVGEPRDDGPFMGIKGPKDMTRGGGRELGRQRSEDKTLAKTSDAPPTGCK